MENTENTNNLKIKLRWKTDLQKGVLTENFLSRGWIETDDEDEWNFYWANVNEIRKIFNAKTFYKLSDNQIINHFPNFYELCRKDCLVKNIKKYKKQLIRENNPAIENYDFLPLTFILPGDMSLFLEEFKRVPGSLWILKPANKAQGNGVVLVNKVNKLKKLNFTSKTTNENNTQVIINESYVISKYIDNPMLIDGKKFDLRLYVLVTSYLPLKVYWHREGFARFCNEDYSIDVNDIDNIYVHLTNVAVQKKNDVYNENHGGKWNFSNLMLYIESIYGYEKVTAVYDGIKAVIVNTLKAVQSTMHSDKHCFELYGFDVILDDELKPWLIEINASPSLSTTTASDFLMKKEVISDMLDVVVSDRWIEEKGKCGTSSCSATRKKGFDEIYDESKRKKEEKKDEKKTTVVGKKV